MANPSLDYAHPLHTFGSVLTYTANTTCYLSGTLLTTNANPDVNLQLTINGTPYAHSSIAGGTNDHHGIPVQIQPLKIESGDTVVVSSACPYLSVYPTK